jgi:cytoskeletal protein RodZ
VADASAEPFGKLLLDARAARGMNLREVSASTKIAVSKLQAIERDEIESLPGGIFTRGFVRSYAEAVGLDPQDTLAKFEARFPDESSVATLHATIAGRANEEFVRRQRTAKGVIWLAVLAVPLVVWLLSAAIPDDIWSPVADEAVSGGAEPVSAPGSEPSPEPPSSPEPVFPPAVESAARSDPAPVAPADSGRLTMEISPTGDCWVVASADGDTVISRLLGAAEREVVVAQNAIELRIGDAGAFAFTINQRPGRSLGASGEVVNVRVTPSNYLSFVAE